MNMHTRRRFLEDVGRGMMVASVGPALATELCHGAMLLTPETDTLHFGTLEPLAAMLQDTPVHKLQPRLVEQLRTGTTLQTLVCAGALANARSFGGQHYVGYHTFMALRPAFEMSRKLPPREQALPILKVLYRNSDTIQQEGGRQEEALRRIHGARSLTEASPEHLQKLVRRGDMQAAEQVFARMVRENPKDAYNKLQLLVRDNLDVHQVVLAWRAWEILDLTGFEHAHTMLRQSVRHCLDRDQMRRDRGFPEPKVRTTVPQTIDEFKLLDITPGTRTGDDAWMENLCRQIFTGNQKQAARAVGEALAEGYATEAVGEAISLAANRLLLQDAGRNTNEGPDKPRGSVHGASVGVHASDSANAWRQIARVTDHANTMATLVVAACHTAGKSHRVSDRMVTTTQQAREIATEDPRRLLAETEACIRDNDQVGACRRIQKYADLGHAEKPVFDLMRRYAVSEDGALHAEKYFRTVEEEFVTTRPSFRWRHLVALARVTASEYGTPAPGRDQARELLKLS